MGGWMEILVDQLIDGSMKESINMWIFMYI